MAPDRRRVLASFATGVSLAAAGCTGLLGRDTPPVADEERPDKEAQAARRPAALLRMQAVTDAAVGHRGTRPGSEYGSEGRLVVREAVENGTKTVEAAFPPVRGGPPVLYDGQVYRFTYEATAERPATLYFWDLEPTDDASADETVPFEDLPEVDRERFRLSGLADGQAGDRTPIDVGGTFRYADADVERSALVPTPERPVVEWGSDRRARFSVTGSSDEDVTLVTYQYAAERLASSAAEYGRRLRRQYAFELSGLTDDERDLVERALEGGYSVERGETPPDAFESLADRFGEHDAVDPGRGGVSGEYLLEYEGEVYWARLIDGEDSSTAETPSASE